MSEREFTIDELEAQIAAVDKTLSGRRLDLYKPYPKQELFHRLGGDPSITDRLLMAGNQAICVDEPVLTPTGWVRMGDIKVGDDVIGSNGQPTRVCNVFDRGVAPVYRVTTRDGSSVRCSNDHRWLVWLESEDDWVDVDTVFLWQLDYTQAHERPKLPLVAPIEFQSEKLPIDPYVVGLMIGDGSMTQGCATFSTADEELVDALQTEFDVVDIRRPARPYGWRLRGDAKRRLTDIGVYGYRSEEKRIPRAYEFASAKDRLALLQGLMDTDGTVSKEKGASFCSTSPFLAATVAAISRSLGGNASINKRLGYTSRGLNKNGHDFYIVHVKLPLGLPPFRLKRKSERYLPTKEPVKVIHSVVREADAECRCITVDALDHLFVTKDYLLTRNCGKTLCAAAEVAMDLSGNYPPWWAGKRFQTNTRIWVGSPTSQTTRDAAQYLLMGPPGEFGTGMIPAKSIVDFSKATHGVPNALESVMVKHTSGKISQLQFKSYDQGRIRWQSATIDKIWFDEEPPMDIFVEGRTRTNVPGNCTMMTFTPLLGMSEVVIRFLQEKPMGSIVVPMTIVDALHYSPEQRDRIIAGYPIHERKARAMGIPILGSGAVFPIEEETLTADAFPIPDHWPRICGMDIGWEHPTACSWMAWDRDTDTIYVYDVHRVKEQTPVFHAATMKAKGAWIPTAWPHDGLQHDKGSGAQIAKQYRDLGVNMLKEKSTHAPEKGKKEGTGGYGLEAGITDLLSRMQTGRFKVFKHLNDWFQEYRMYHRKDGLIVKQHDDLMSATRIGVMMLRFAKQKRQDLNQTPKVPAFQASYSSTGVLG